MNAISRSFALAALLTAAPVVAVLAQGTTSTPGTTPAYQGSAATNPHGPGATGDTVVKGDKSTIAGDRRATKEQQKTGSSTGSD